MELFAAMEQNMAKSGMNEREDRSSRNSSSGGSISSEKSRMLDITRDKPIKVAVRVAVPVRDHPKFNFVGKLLGPKGNSMKRLQEDTMCKMAVLGRGSMKDRKKEEELRLSGDPRYSHLLEDLHVEISTFAAPAEAHARIAYALAEVRRFLVPDYHDDIRHEQMWEMQALSSSQNQSQEISNASTNSSSTTDLLSGSGPDPVDMNGIGVTDCVVVAASVNNNNGTNTVSLVNSCSGDTINNAMQIDVTPLTANNQNPQVVNGGSNNIIPATGVAAISAITQNSSILTMIPNEAETQTVSLVETPGGLLHPALRGVKTVNIGSLARKRPLLGVPRSNMNPTKRTVMTLLARAKNSQALHSARTTLGAALGEPQIQMITSPLILQQPLDVIQHNGNGTVAAIQKENILQGA